MGFRRAETMAGWDYHLSLGPHQKKDGKGIDAKMDLVRGLMTKKGWGIEPVKSNEVANSSFEHI